VYEYNTLHDREIAGFFAAIMSWGRREIVIKKVGEVLSRMGKSPGLFIRQWQEDDAIVFKGFVHRTFKAGDIAALCRALHRAAGNHTSLEPFFQQCWEEAKTSGRDLAAVFHDRFLAFSGDGKDRLERHITTPERGSACKRFWLFLRWMVRTHSPVDAGLWQFMPASELQIPLDVHVATTARSLGLLKRTANDHKAVTELMTSLKKFNPDDPVRYDFALFGIGLERQHPTDASKNE
jgi:uncharacterized protein (TIGR02757 family)